MWRALKRWRASGFILLLGAVVLWPFPVVRILHVESAIVIATLAWFTTGVAAATGPRSLGGFRKLLGAHVVYLALPLSALTVSLAWAPNCAYPTGVAFFVLYTLPSVFLGGAIGHAIRVQGGRPILSFALATAAVLVGGLAYDLALHPQFYTFNHVFGGVLGPLYDEDVTVTAAVLWFRLLTCLWAALLILLTMRWRAGRGPRAVTKRVGVHAIGLPSAALAIGLIYLFSPRLGINTPAWFIRQELGGHTKSEHFDLYHSKEMDEAEALQFLSIYEYQYDRLAGQLGVAPARRVAVYLYPDPFTRERLTGARVTNVAPIWLRQPQVHVLEDVPERVHAHELVHVFSREFGLPLVKASFAVGLMEGLAVALEGPSGGPSPHDQVGTMLGDPRFDVSDVATRLAPSGFWGGRGAVSYTSTGSFVQFLLDEYGSEVLRRTYAFGRFRSHYGKDVHSLAHEWESFLRSREVVSAFAARTAVQRFSIPSLFEVRCPHYVPPYRKRLLDAQRLLADGDSTSAMSSLERSLALRPDYAPAALVLADIAIVRDEIDRANEALSQIAPTPARDVRLADISALRGDSEQALIRLEDVERSVPRGALDSRGLLLVRRAVTGDSAAVRALYVAPSQPRAVSTPSEALVYGRALVVDGRPAEALQVLTSVDKPEPAQLDEAGWLVARLWFRITSEAALRAGEAALALSVAEDAHRQATARGDVDSAALFAHYVHRARWASTVMGDVNQTRRE
jgi:hypothetical protein